MNYKPFVHDGPLVSTVGFGASPLGNVFGAVSQSNDDALIGSAIFAGINFFDASPYYGLGLAEERLGKALVGRRDQVFLATKCGRYGVSDFDFSKSSITTRVEQSLKRLRTNQVDLLQVHDIEFGDIGQIVEETLPALLDLKKQGKTRFVGITSYWPGLLANTLRRFPLDCALNYCHWNFFSDDMDTELTPTCQELGVTLINASPLHMGLLSGGPVAEWHCASPSVRQTARQATEACARFGVSPGVLATWKTLQHPSVTTTLVGMADRQQVDDACKAQDFVPPPALLQEMEDIMRAVQNQAWPQGRPENEDLNFRAARKATIHDGEDRCSPISLGQP